MTLIAFLIGLCIGLLAARWYAALQGRDGTGARALQLLALTATRFAVIERDTNFFGLTAGTVRKNVYLVDISAATNVNANLQNPNELILQQHFDNIFAITAMYPNKWIFSQDWKRAYLAGFFGKRQFTTNSYDGGASSLSFSAVQMGTNEAGKKPVMLDKCEDYMMDPSEYFLFSDQAVCKASDFKKGIHIADEDNTEFRFIQPFDAQGGFTRNWYQLIYKHRRAVGRGYGFATVAGGT
jgi:hypothetical protein